MLLPIVTVIVFTSICNIQNTEARQSKEASILLKGMRRLPSQDCFEPMNIGGYMANHKFWYFDPDTLRCRSFRYGGEQEHNGNHFETWMGCFAKCKAYFG